MLRFEKACDFQYRADEGASVLGLLQMDPMREKAEDLAAEPLLVRPREFASFPNHAGYHFNQNPNRKLLLYKMHHDRSASHLDSVILGLSAAEPVLQYTTIRELTAATVLPSPGAQSQSQMQVHGESGHVSDVYDVLTAFLRAMFDERPVWPPPLIAHRLRSLPEEVAKKYKPAAVMGGIALWVVCPPYCRLWLKVGFDPRKSPSSVDFQSVDVRIPYRVFDEVTSLVLSGAALWRHPGYQSDLKRFDPEAFSSKPLFSVFSKYLFSRQYLFPICEIAVDPRIATIVRSSIEPEWREKFGWLTPSAISKIQSILLEDLHSFMMLVTSDPVRNVIGSVNWLGGLVEMRYRVKEMRELHTMDTAGVMKRQIRSMGRKRGRLAKEESGSMRKQKTRKTSESSQAGAAEKQKSAGSLTLSSVVRADVIASRQDGDPQVDDDDQEAGEQDQEQKQKRGQEEEEEEEEEEEAESDDLDGDGNDDDLEDGDLDDGDEDELEEFMGFRTSAIPRAILSQQGIVEDDDSDGNSDDGHSGIVDAGGDLGSGPNATATFPLRFGGRRGNRVTCDDEYEVPVPSKRA
eukprot:ANDGO_05763.mRNA.2 hypothetical protein